MIHGQKGAYSIKYTQIHGDTRSPSFPFASGNFVKCFCNPRKAHIRRGAGLYFSFDRLQVAASGAGNEAFNGIPA